MIRVLVTNYNNEPYIKRCLDSILYQEVMDWRCHIMDDLSSDKSLEIIKKIIGEDSRFTVIENEHKLYQIGNYDNIIRNFGIDDNDICVTVDGDDWLIDRNVFDRVLDAYSDSNIWMASGGMISVSGTRSYAVDIEMLLDPELNKHPFHLRTFRAFLWRMIPDRQLKDATGNYFRVGGDVAFSLFMIKVARNHFRMLDGLNYGYNDLNPLCNHFLRQVEQKATADFIRKRESILY